MIAIAANLIVGAILLALFLWRRPSAAGSIGDATAALAFIRGTVPEAAGRLALSTDGQAALLMGAAPSMTCLLQQHGHRLNVRSLRPGDVATVTEFDGVIQLRLRDFGWPACCLCIPDAQLRFECLERLNELRTNALSTSSTVGSHA